MNIRDLWLYKRDGVISLAVLLGVLGLVFLLLLDPVLGQVQRYRSELAKDARLVQEMRGIVAMRDELQANFTAYQEQGLEGWVYSGGSVNNTVLDIQRRVTDQLTLASAQVSSVSPVTAKRQDEYLLVGVEVRFTAGMRTLMEVLQALEQERPLLLVNNLRITPQAQRRTRQGVVPEQLISVQMTVQTYLVPEPEQAQNP